MRLFAIKAPFCLLLLRTSFLNSAAYRDYHMGISSLANYLKLAASELRLAEGETARGPNVKIKSEKSLNP